MRRVIPRARVLRQENIPGKDDVLCHPRPAAEPEPGSRRSLVHVGEGRERMILAVLDDRHVEHARVLQRASHDAGRHDAHAIVADADRAGLAQLGHLRQLLTLLTHRDRRNRMELRSVELGRPPQHQLGHRSRVVDRLRVRHHAHVGVSARRRRRQPGGDILLVLVARLSQMGVEVDEGGQEPPARAVDDPRPLALGRLHARAPADAGHLSALDHDVDDLVEAASGIDGTDAANDEQIGWGAHAGAALHRCPNRSNAVSRNWSRLAAPFSRLRPSMSRIARVLALVPLVLGAEDIGRGCSGCGQSP